MYRNFFKRFLDFVISLFVFILLSPLFLILIFFLYLANRGTGVFFLQERPGKDAKIYKVIKFKTMNDKRNAQGELLQDEERITPIGKFIRSLSLDELPQLINVIKGEMSLIGPRPLMVKYLPLYSEFQSRRHEVRPGITGWAQVNGRNTISWQKKFELDVWYVDNVSFLLDLKIIFLTIKRVFKREGISQQGHATVEPFTRNN